MSEFDPQPKPQAKGVEVHSVLVEWLEKHKEDLGEQDTRTVLNLARERYDFGLKKYGQPLMSEDGRDTEKDFTDELLDALIYGMKAKINKTSLDRFRLILKVLNKLADE